MQNAIAADSDKEIPMPVPDAKTVLEEIKEEAILPNPVRVRDMIFHAQLAPARARELNLMFLEYQKHFGECLKLGEKLLAELALSQP